MADRKIIKGIINWLKVELWFKERRNNGISFWIVVRINIVVQDSESTMAGIHW